MVQEVLPVRPPPPGLGVDTQGGVPVVPEFHEEQKQGNFNRGGKPLLHSRRRWGEVDERVCREGHKNSSRYWPPEGEQQVHGVLKQTDQMLHVGGIDMTLWTARPHAYWCTLAGSTNIQTGWVISASHHTSHTKS